MQEGFLELIPSLCYADTALISGCVKSLVVNLVPFDVPPSPTLDSNGEWVPPGKTKMAQDRVIQTLAKVT